MKMISLLAFHQPSAARGGVSLHGTTMYDWGMDDEAGMLSESFERSVMIDEKIVKSANGEVGAWALYNLHADYSIGGYIKTAALIGIPATAPGATMTIANETSGQGVTTGIVVCKSNNIKRAAEDFVHCDAAGTQYPGITV